MNWDPKSAPKLDFEEDLYSVLEVDDSIKSKDLKKAYYKLVFKYHPDNKEGEAAKALSNKQMMVINNAYKVLKEDDTRAAYDRKRKFGALDGKASSTSSRRHHHRTKEPNQVASITPAMKNLTSTSVNTAHMAPEKVLSRMKERWRRV